VQTLKGLQPKQFSMPSLPERYVSSAVMYDYYITVLIHFQQHNSFKEFANKGWRHLEKMEEIFPEGGASGTYVF